MIVANIRTPLLWKTRGANATTTGVASGITAINPFIFSNSPDLYVIQTTVAASAKKNEAAEKYLAMLFSSAQRSL